MLHYDRAYLCQSHLDMAASLRKFGFRGGRQLLAGVGRLRRGGIGGPWFLTGFGRGLGDLGLF